MKTCIGKCGKEKEDSEFGKVAKNKDGLNGKCKECKRDYDNEYTKNRSDEAKEQKQKSKNKRLDRLRDKKIEYLKGHHCVDCGEDDVVVLDFDHDDPEDKTHNVADMIRRGYSFEKLKNEIDKCTVRCANCHRRRTAKQFNWYINNIGD